MRPRAAVRAYMNDAASDDARMARGGAARPADARGHPSLSAPTGRTSRPGLRARSAARDRESAVSSRDDAFTRKDGTIIPVAYSGRRCAPARRHGFRPRVPRHHRGEGRGARTREARARRADLGRADPRRAGRGPPRPLLAADRPAQRGRTRRPRSCSLRMVVEDGRPDPAGELPPGRREVRADRGDRPLGVAQAIGWPRAGATSRSTSPGRRSGTPGCCRVSSRSCGRPGSIRRSVTLRDHRDGR